jgi:Zn-dependent peptidase ImmA (M78 family)
MVKRRASKPWTSAAARRLLEIAGNPSTIEDAVQIVAQQVLSGVSCPPTDLDEIIHHLNITEVISEDLPVSGEMHRNGSGFKIIYSSSSSLEQRRFTIAHEIGHVIFESSGRNCPRFGQELERLCDMLATEILLPKTIFLDLLGTELSMQKVFDLKRIFKVSLSATAIRCAQFRQVSFFEVEDETVIWGYGVIKKNPLRRMESALRRLVEEALSGNSEKKVEHLENTIWNVTNTIWKGPWKLEWRHLGRERRALFLLQPISPSNYS